jgi:hypothetical protein
VVRIFISQFNLTFSSFTAHLLIMMVRLGTDLSTVLTALGLPPIDGEETADKKIRLRKNVGLFDIR